MIRSSDGVRLSRRAALQAAGAGGAALAATGLGGARLVAQSPEVRYTLDSRMYPYGTTAFADVLLKVLGYNLTGVIDQIQCPSLVVEAEGEQFVPGQAEKVYEALRSPKQLVRFTAAEGADLHCEPKANALRSQVYFDWLDETLKVGNAG